MTNQRYKFRDRESVFEQKIEEQNIKIFGYIANVTISMITTLITLRLVGII